jgi:hypothetical protein
LPDFHFLSDALCPTIDPARKYYESRHSGLGPKIQSKPTMACFDRHGIPASAGMMFVLFARRIN